MPKPVISAPSLQLKPSVLSMSEFPPSISDYVTLELEARIVVEPQLTPTIHVFCSPQSVQALLTVARRMTTRPWIVAACRRDRGRHSAQRFAQAPQPPPLPPVDQILDFVAPKHALASYSCVSPVMYQPASTYQPYSGRIGSRPVEERAKCQLPVACIRSGHENDCQMNRPSSPENVVVIEYSPEYR